jgi:hypothetical protein
MIDFDAAFCEQFFDIAVGPAVTEVPANGQQDHVGREPVPAKETDSTEQRRLTSTRFLLGPDPTRQRTSPALGYVGPDGVCFNGWISELGRLRTTLASDELAAYIYEGGQDHTAYQIGGQ